MTTKTKIFNARTTVQGFTFTEGFAALLDENGNILAATSGWDYEDALYVYRPTPEGEWVGGWESEETFPVREVRAAILEYERDEQINKSLRYLKGRKPHISDEVISFTDAVAGRKSRDGGEYGFWTEWHPIPSFPGVYEVWSCTTCEISDCGTGYEGIMALTEDLYKEMRAESDRIEKEGFRQ